MNFEDIFRHRFGELLKYLGKNGDKFRESYGNGQSSGYVIDVCGQDFRHFGYLVDSCEGAVIGAVYSIVIDMLNEAHIEYEVPTYEEPVYRDKSVSDRTRPVYPYPFVLREGGKRVAYDFMYGLSTIRPLREKMDRYTDIDALKVYFLWDDEYSRIKVFNEIETEEDRCRIQFGILRNFFDDMFGSEVYPVFAKYAGEFNEKARNTIGFSMMAVPTKKAVAVFKDKTLDKLRQQDYRKLVNGGIDESRYQAVHKRYITGGLVELMTGTSDFADSFISSEWHKDTDVITGVIDETAIGVGYLKSVEQLLYAVLKLFMKSGRKIQVNEKEWKASHPSTNTVPAEIDFIQANEPYFNKTLGSLFRVVKSLERENNWYGIFASDPDTVRFMVDTLYHFKDYERNDRLHKDNLYSEKEITDIRDQSYLLYFLILGSFKISGKDQSALGKEIPIIHYLTDEELQTGIEEWALPLLRYDMPKESQVLTFHVDKFNGSPWTLSMKSHSSLDPKYYNDCPWDAYNIIGIRPNSSYVIDMDADWEAGKKRVLSALKKIIEGDSETGKLMRQFPEVLFGSTKVDAVLFRKDEEQQPIDSQ